MAKRNALKVVTPTEETSPEVTDQEWESAAKVRKEKLTWLMPGRIVAGAVNILEGEKGVSKSTFSALLCSCVTAGKTYLGMKKQKPSTVLWLPGEEDVARVVLPRLEAAGANMGRVLFPPVSSNGIRWRPTFPGDIDTLRERIDRSKASLVIIDPLSCYVPSQCDLRNDQVIHEVLDPFGDVAAATGCTILLNRNLTKNKYASRLDRGQGGAAVAGVARAVLCIDWPDRKKPKRVLRVVACNLTHETPAAEYIIEDNNGFGCIRKFTLVDPEDDEEQRPDDDDAERDVRADAKTMLKKLLDKSAVEVSVILQEACSIQVSPRTLRTAKKELGITSHRKVVGKKAKWEWKKPASGWKKERGV